MSIVDGSRRSESRTSRISAPGEHADAVHSTLTALEEDVKKTTELIKRRREEQLMDKRTFQSEMEVSGRISVEPQEDWLTLRLKSVSTEDMRKELGKVKEGQHKNVVQDTLAALVYDVNATAEVLRRGSLKRKKPRVHEEIEYRLRLTPAQDDTDLYHHEEQKPIEPPPEDYTLETDKKDYGVDLSESITSSLKRRARSTTPRRTINVDGSPGPDSIPICAYCSEEIDGPVLTALAPNAVKAQKFHPYHFMCCYCQKALNLRGTYREHDRRPYCHECFYKLYNGLLYEPDVNQSKLEKLI
ncbi:LIM domain-containing protein [Ditylenchus destructor]|uniref:LIM domain-containing protein n=1 Tax=Ditylenchus destructor TaxID=166010 RepID=A0AAD4MS23_9BILA|nr:LIM domain-containing protein [Ditylenchus destructor]